MKVIFTTIFLACCFLSHAQVFWSEDFGTGCSQGNVASAYTGSNGAWTISGTGTNDADANQWFVSATEAGMGAGNCGDGCGITPSLVNRTLHLSNVETLFTSADGGATYNAGGVCTLGICVTTNRRAESPVIDCTNKFNVSVSFNYLENGDGANDDATLWYYDGTSWTQLQNMAKTPLACAPQGQWTAFTTNLPASANNNADVKIGFNWTNNDDGVGTDPSFAVDDVQLSGVEPVCDLTLEVSDVTCAGLCNGNILATATGQSPVLFAWSNGATSDTLTGLCPGVYDLTILDALGCTASANALVVEPLPLAVVDSVLEEAQCDSCFNGMAQATAGGGTPPYTYVWSNGQSDALNVYLNPGMYSYTVTDGNGCTASDSVEVMNLTGVASVNGIINWDVFPNPVVNELTVAFSASVSGSVSLSIFDAVGRSCYVKNIDVVNVGNNILSVNVAALSPGVYSVSLRNEHGSTVKKIIVLP